MPQKCFKKHTYPMSICTNLNHQHLLKHILHLLPCLGRGAKSLLWVKPTLLLNPSIKACMVLTSHHRSGPTPDHSNSGGHPGYGHRPQPHQRVCDSRDYLAVPSPTPSRSSPLPPSPSQFLSPKPRREHGRYIPKLLVKL